MTTDKRATVWCWHRSAIHGGYARSSVKIVRTRPDGWVLVRFEDGHQTWVLVSELEEKGKQ